MAKTTVTATLTDGSKVELPEELVQWFQTGSTLAKRFGLKRFDVIFKIVQAWSVYPDGEPHISVDRWAERKTYASARRLRDRWARESGRSALVQTGVVIWLTEEELDKIPTRRVYS